MADSPKTIFYKRYHFVTHLPAHYLYTPSHAWAEEIEPGLWRVGMTRFATRMLGEMVDHGFDVKPGANVKHGEIIGWVEGFKAISDIFCVVNGMFEQNNSELPQKISLVSEDCYGKGWLYMVRGKPDPNCMDVHAYQAVLDKTIDKILEKQKNNEIQ
jgi:glycine cleavage system H protein